MQIGIRLHDAAGETLEQKVQNAKAQGFRCVHLALSKALPGFTMDRAPELLTADLARELKDLFQRYDMPIAVLGCYLNLATPDEEEYRRNLEIYAAHLRFAPLVGAGAVGTETGNTNVRYEPDAQSQTEDALALFLTRVAPVIACAEKEGATLAIEPVCRHIVSTPERAARVLDAYPTDKLRIILDLVNLLNMANYAQADQVLGACVAHFGDKIHMLHMKDYRPRPGETDVESLACGQGVMDYTALLAFARSRPGLPMTLEETRPDTAEAARRYLEQWK